MKKTPKNEDTNNIDHYYRNNRFFDLLFNTGKLKDLLWSKEAFVSLFFSITLTLLLAYLGITNNPVKGTNSIIPVLNTLYPIIIGGLFGILGFIIGGLAIITGTISVELLTKIIDKNQLKELMSIIFNFYFSGAVTGLTVILAILTSVVTSLQIPFEWYLFIPWSIVLSYFVVFSIIYSIMLLGTCIRILLLKYFILKNDKKSDD
ncbi:hypothetical protein [Peribacillus sp. N1]